MIYFDRKWQHHKAVLAILVVLLIVLITLRIYFNTWALNYVNHVLANVEGYQGSVQSIDIDLYRGAYRINKLVLFKKTGNIPVPFLNIQAVDFSIEWGALARGRIVSNIDLSDPIINFAISQSGDKKQTGAETDWTQPIRELSPIDINLVTFTGGKLSYKDFSTSPKIDLYIHQMSGEIKNLRNVDNKNEPMPSTIWVRGNSIGGGTLDLQGRINILKPVPDMDISAKLEKVSLPAMNTYTSAYAGIDIEKGNLNVYSEFIVKDKRVSGYIKPIATNIKIISLEKTNPIKLAWESLVASVVEIFSNQSKDQFATKIILEGSLDNVDNDTWSTIAGILRNAFIQAFNNGLDNDTKQQTPANKKP